MPLFRRREPLHERLAREGGLGARPVEEPARPAWLEAGIHGVPRQREWDAVVTVETEEVDGEEARFVALPGGALLVEQGSDVEALAAALAGTIDPPYRAEGVRRSGRRWAVGARRIEVVELPDDPSGQAVTLSVRDGERALAVDGDPAFGSIPALERLGAARAPSYVVEARRLDGRIWEVQVTPL